MVALMILCIRKIIEKKNNEILSYEEVNFIDATFIVRWSFYYKRLSNALLSTCRTHATISIGHYVDIRHYEVDRRPDPDISFIISQFDPLRLFCGP